MSGTARASGEFIRPRAALTARMTVPNRVLLSVP
jgi:hypothetical protein